MPLFIFSKIILFFYILFCFHAGACGISVLCASLYEQCVLMHVCMCKLTVSRMYTLSVECVSAEGCETNEQRTLLSGFFFILFFSSCVYTYCGCRCTVADVMSDIVCFRAPSVISFSPCVKSILVENAETC